MVIFFWDTMNIIETGENLWWGKKAQVLRCSEIFCLFGFEDTSND